MAITLISFDACPFVQRAAILLQEQERAYDIKYIDLANRPDWFLEISPSGKVPVLEVDGTPIFESAVILEYLDETSGEHKLLPDDPVERAQQRMWIAYISNIMSKGWQLQAAGDEEAVRKIAEELKGHFAELDRQLSDDGPYWGGDTYSMVDVAIAPIMQRFTWAEKLESSLGLFDELPRIAAWRDALLERSSTHEAIVDDLEQRSAKMLHQYGSWVARNAAA